MDSKVDATKTFDHDVFHFEHQHKFVDCFVIMFFHQSSVGLFSVRTFVLFRVLLIVASKKGFTIDLQQFRQNPFLNSLVTW